MESQCLGTKEIGMNGTPKKKTFFNNVIVGNHSELQ